MKIAIVGLTGVGGGGAVSHRLFMLARGLAYRGHETYLVTPYKLLSGQQMDEIDGVKIIGGGYINSESTDNFIGIIAKRLLLIKKIQSLLSKGLDWLILYDLGLDNLPFILLAHRYGCYVASEKCDIRLITYNRLKDSIIKYSYDISDRFLTPRYKVNFTVTTYLAKKLNLIAPHVSTLIIPAIIDADKFNYNELEAHIFRKKWGLQDSFLVAYTGSLQPIHGLEILLKAAYNLINCGKTFKLVICGKFVYDLRKQEIMKLVEDYHLEEHLLFTGFLSTVEVVAALSAADILVSSQIDHIANTAGFPQKIAEYLAMAKPVVTSATGDIPQYLRDGDNALLCRPGDPESLTQALDSLMENPDLCSKLSRRARETALQYFDCRIIAGHIEHKFNELMQSSR